MDARACMHSYCSALPPSQASSLLMLHVHVQKRPFSRPSIAENKNLALTCAPVSPHGAAGHKNQRRVLVWLFRSPPLPCQVSSRIGYGSCAASTCPFPPGGFFLGGGGSVAYSVSPASRATHHLPPWRLRYKCKVREQCVTA